MWLLRQLGTRTTMRRCSFHTVIAMSGGVDSSVAAALVTQKQKQQSSINNIATATCSALYMANWNAHDDDTLHCTSERDYQDVQRVIDSLPMTLKLQHQSFEQEYWNLVFWPFLEQLQKKNGTMGNPDIACNTHIKFGVLPEYCIRKYGADTKIATGHYARLWHRGEHAAPTDVQAALDRNPSHAWIQDWGTTTSSNENSNPPSLLLSAVDKSKDQSYFLSNCCGFILQRVLFPLGHLYKNNNNNNKKNGQASSVRALAAQWNLPTARKADSMGICFIGNRQGSSFRDFVQSQYVPDATTPVNFVDIDTGECLDTTAPEPSHAFLYTPGQGAKISGMHSRYFVVSVQQNDDTESIVHVCAGTHHPALYTDSLMVQDVSWIARTIPSPLVNIGSWRTQCRIRHLQPLIDCTVTVGDEGRLQVTFDRPVRGVTVGQHAVFYGLEGLVCLGGGPIQSRGPTYFEMGKQLPEKLAPAGHNDCSSR